MSAFQPYHFFMGPQTIKTITISSLSFTFHCSFSTEITHLASVSLQRRVKQAMDGRSMSLLKQDGKDILWMGNVISRHVGKESVKMFVLMFNLDFNLSFFYICDQQATSLCYKG